MEGGDHKFNNKASVSYHELVKDPIEEKLQLAKEFEARFGKERVLRIIEEMSIRGAVSRAGKRAEELDIRSLEDYARWVEKMHLNEVPMNTQTMETIELTAQKYHFKVKECLWAKVYRDLNAPEYGLAFECCTDFPVCQIYNKALRLKREKTLMNGDDCCDFIYTWDDGSSV